ncbi:SpoVR family protein|uniref:Stage V sporulation protein R n=1 Tax=Dendrosporobacter quercicolus TaxID=146817 RepID=A0A1G9W944_9FIRM|nr:SpoVR family protein [Dendrosporobacter quercicolus]NSL47687.1 SpoVR family protein [Dendrosporobacter quercicolus DSM 1736]SDM80793.1 stage V sporulation protein R [Dendrosporobacter quercicolus]
MTAEYSINDLTYWNNRIEEAVKAIGLDCYEQHFEICSCEDMLCYEAYVGMPAHYPHWSYGKAYERQKTYYQYNLTGLPYEMVINSDPCLAYLMRDNTLLLQILTMAHVYGHNDFFKNNRLFKRDTRAELTLEMFKAHADRVRSYIQDPGIGPDKVERILDAAHALRFQVPRNGPGRAVSRPVLNEETPEAAAGRLQDDLLGFLAERGALVEWERDLVHIVRDESVYFMPQIETKIMNEGWASYWHYQILQQLELPQKLHLEFLQRHNLVVRPHQGQINPYFVGFKLFEYLNRQYGASQLMTIRADERDQSFLRRYLTRELCEDLSLFTHDVQGEDIVVTEVSDDEGWKKIRDVLAQSVGTGNIPVIKPQSVEQGKLMIGHSFDGRELELNYARETLNYVAALWGGTVELNTVINGQTVVLSATKN